jgi:hypothetical protein
MTDTTQRAVVNTQVVPHIRGEKYYLWEQIYAQTKKLIFSLMMLL